MADHQDGDLDDDDPIWVWDGMGQTCSVCGTAREGTTGVTVAHWHRCAGMVVYGRLCALGVDPYIATVAARQFGRELLTVGNVADVRTLLHQGPVLLRKPTDIRIMLQRLAVVGQAVDPAFAETRRRMDATKTVAPFVHARAALRTEPPVVEKAILR